jgi:hypothetical protein
MDTALIGFKKKVPFLLIGSNNWPFVRRKYTQEKKYNVKYTQEGRKGGREGGRKEKGGREGWRKEWRKEALVAWHGRGGQRILGGFKWRKGGVVSFGTFGFSI